jgi:hypothetical protein
MAHTTPKKPSRQWYKVAYAMDGSFGEQVSSGHPTPRGLSRRWISSVEAVTVNKLAGEAVGDLLEIIARPEAKKVLLRAGDV